MHIPTDSVRVRIQANGRPSPQLWCAVKGSEPPNLLLYSCEGLTVLLRRAHAMQYDTLETAAFLQSQLRDCDPSYRFFESNRRLVRHKRVACAVSTLVR